MDGSITVVPRYRVWYGALKIDSLTWIPGNREEDAEGGAMQFDLENVVAELVGSSLTEYNVTASEWRLSLSATLTVGSRPGLPSLPRMGQHMG